MITKRKWEWKKVHIIGLLVLVYLGCLGVLSFIGYSDGDDTFFLEYCGSMGFFEYLQWRYETWTGRMISEGLMHIFFNMDLWVWRFVNAGMLVALPLSLVTLKHIVVGQKMPATGSEKYSKVFLDLFFALLFYLILDIKAFGYSTIWITGSMNYLWPMVCGIVALCVVAVIAFDTEDRKVPGWLYVISTLCAVIAAMSSEQMGAVLLAFEVICIGERVWKKKTVRIGLLVQTAATLGAYLISSFAPGNELRIVAAIEANMPQFEILTLGERFFVLVQWLVSSFANENAVFMLAIWVLGALLLIERKTASNARKTNFIVNMTSVFIAVALLGKIGFTTFTDLGINLAEMSGVVEQVPVVSDMSEVQWIVLGWWILAIIFTFYLLWEVSRAKPVILLTYLGAIATEVILIFSPTIYSSGERVFFLAGIMLMIIVMVLFEDLQIKKIRTGYVWVLTMLAIGNLGLQAMELLAMIAG
ncbi:MAG: hypothetical protein IJZ23_09495 [Roseburia sp.]|nr:hypothetical protein [Roseburia sp.]